MYLYLHPRRVHNMLYKEHFTETGYPIPYSLLSESIADGNPISWAGETSQELLSGKRPPLTNYHYLDKTKVDSDAYITYQGSGIPLANEAVKTKNPDSGLLYPFQDKQCRPECCYGRYPSGYSCDRGCICNYKPKEGDN